MRENHSTNGNGTKGIDVWAILQSAIRSKL
jgi:hypothetical protein